MRSKPFYIVLSVFFTFYILLLFQIYSLRAKLKDEKHTNRIKRPSWSKKIVTSDKIYDLTWCPELHLYRINGKPVLWFFWDKAPLPTHLKLSLATVMCHNDHDFHIQIVFEQELSAWTGDIHPAYQFLSPNHKSDYFRARVLAYYGGMYVDTDTIGLHNFIHLFAKLKDYDVVNCDWWPMFGVPRHYSMYLTIMGPMRASTTLMRQFVEKQSKVLTSKLMQLRNANKTRGKYPITWNEIMAIIMNPLVEHLLNKKAYRFYKMDGPGTFGQLHTARLSTKPRHQLNSTHQYVLEDIELLTYYNSHMDKRIGKMNEKEFLQSDMLIPTLIRFTMKRCRIHNFSDFPLETKVTIGKNEINVDKDLVEWIINYREIKKIN